MNLPMLQDLRDHGNHVGFCAPSSPPVWSIRAGSPQRRAQPEVHQLRFGLEDQLANRQGTPAVGAQPGPGLGGRPEPPGPKHLSQNTSYRAAQRTLQLAAAAHLQVSATKQATIIKSFRQSIRHHFWPTFFPEVNANRQNWQRLDDTKDTFLSPQGKHIPFFPPGQPLIPGEKQAQQGRTRTHLRSDPAGQDGAAGRRRAGCCTSRGRAGGPAQRPGGAAGSPGRA